MTRPSSIRIPHSAIRNCLLLLTALPLGAAGCIPNQPIEEGMLDRTWLLTDVAPDPVDPNEPPAPAPAPAGLRVPTRWVIRQHDSLIWSTVSIVRAMDKLKAGADEIEFSVSPGHAKALVGVLAEARAAMADLKDMLDTSHRTDKNRWADALAAALIKVESVSRLVTMEPDGAGATSKAEPMGMAAEPMLGMIAMYLNERAEGSLLSDLSPAELGRLRDVLAEMVVKLGFEVAGKAPTEGLRQQVADMLRHAEKPPDARGPLTELLARRLSEAAPARTGSDKREIVRTVLTWAPKGLQLLEMFLNEWDRMESITVERIRRGGESGVAITVTALPDKPVRVADVTVLVPTIVFRGATRITVVTDRTGAKETVVAFEPVGEGAVELRFEGIVYGLTKLLAMPLADGPLREIRVASRAHGDGERLVHVAVLTEATADKTDPRRMIVVQDSRTKKLVRGLFAIERTTEASRTVVNYLTPTRRYTYQRVKGAEAE